MGAAQPAIGRGDRHPVTPAVEDVAAGSVRRSAAGSPSSTAPAAGAGGRTAGRRASAPARCRRSAGTARSATSAGPAAGVSAARSRPRQPVARAPAAPPGGARSPRGGTAAPTMSSRAAPPGLRALADERRPRPAAPERARAVRHAAAPAAAAPAAPGGLGGQIIIGLDQRRPAPGPPAATRIWSSCSWS